MAWSQEFAGAALVGERTETAFRVPMGVVSPLWAMFGAAASAGVAYWWMTRWTRAGANFEALAAFSPTAALESTPIELIAEPEPALAAEPAILAAVEAGPAEPPVLAAADDLTVMSGIGPKLCAALAERGVTRFAQIAAWTNADLAEVDTALSLKGRAVREAWVAQAKRLASAQ
jgi:predicted flap endonuclease-1-like 5' DNA nuclease